MNTTSSGADFEIKAITTGANASVDGTPVSRLYINNAGYVGIGTTSPICALDVIGSVHLHNTTQDTGMTISCGNGTFTSIESFNAANTTKRNIALNAYGGYVGIGTTNPVYGLDVNGMINCNNLFRVTNGSAYTNLQYDRIQFQTGGSGPFYVLNSNSAGVRLDNGTTSWTTQSDGRLKNIIEPITDAISKIDKLNPVIYSWISDDSNTRQVGLLAQDVLKVQPESVSVDPNDGYLGVRYTELIPLAFAGIKEQKVIIQTQQSQIHELQTENTDLKSRLNALEARLTAAGF